MKEVYEELHSKLAPRVMNSRRKSADCKKGSRIGNIIEPAFGAARYVRAHQQHASPRLRCDQSCRKAQLSVQVPRSRAPGCAMQPVRHEVLALAGRLHAGVGVGCRKHCHGGVGSFDGGDHRRQSCLQGGFLQGIVCSHGGKQCQALRSVATSDSPTGPLPRWQIVLWTFLPTTWWMMHT